MNYKKLGCKITLLDRESDGFKMIINYLEKTYEPIKVGEIVSTTAEVAAHS